jgi:hypothetical protein
MLTDEQRARIERNKAEARARLQARLQGEVAAPVPAAEPTPMEHAKEAAEADAPAPDSELTALVAELAASRRSSPDEAVQCYARLEASLREASAEAFKDAIADRLDCIIVRSPPPCCSAKDACPSRPCSRECR